MRVLQYKKTLITFFTGFVVLFFSARWYIDTIVQSPMLANNASPVVITVERSATATQFLQTLYDKRLILSPKTLLAIMRFKHLSYHLKAGIYQVKPGELPMDFIYRVVSGDVMHFYFTIIAGTTQKKVGEDLAKAAYLEYKPSFWSLVVDAHPNAEGLLLADTYQYRAGSSAASLLYKAHKSLIDYLNQVWTTRDVDLPYKTAYQLLIAASIIEKETALPRERELISGVLINRLKKNMPLQMDPTVIYALGDSYKGSLTHSDLLVHSPYNSYHNRGLPPTPIAMVGKEALRAAAHPLLSKYLYFVAKGDGSHQFSATYEEQKRAINQYMHRGS